MTNKQFTTDVDQYLFDRATKIKASSELELETIEMHEPKRGVPMNEASIYAKADAQTKIATANYLLGLREKVR